MTENELRNLVVDTAKKYLGCKESDGSHRKIIDIYNASKPLARGYAVRYTDAWCATFVSAVGILCELKAIMPTECGCGQLIQLYKNKGRWIESDNYVPKIGDIVMYDWDDNGVGDCTGWPEHVGIVVSISGNTMKIIEGNISNAVGYRDLVVNAKYIRGYCVPDYASVATEKSSTTVSKPANNSGSSTVAKPATPAKTAVDPAKSFLNSLGGTYKVTASALNVRAGAGTSKKILTTILNGKEVKCYGYYTTVSGVKWLFIQFEQDKKTFTGFASSKYLAKKS